MKGWLINDTLTCIPGTKTLWHDLLDWLPSLEDKTGGNTPFSILPEYMEQLAQVEGPPDYVIRNGTFFRPLKFRTKTISLIQDIYNDDLKAEQVRVGNSSDFVVYNSEYTKSFYSEYIKAKSKIIPLGVDFDYFAKCEESHPQVLPNSILFVGAANFYPKGFDLVEQLIHNTDYNFCLVMKDGFTWDHPRVRVFNQVNHNSLRKIYSSCSMILCTSVHETQHLAGIEGAACGLPVVAANVGVYHKEPDWIWGHRVERNYADFLSAIDKVMNNRQAYSPREYFKARGLDKTSCKKAWIDLVNEITK